MAANFFSHDMTPQDPKTLEIASFSPPQQTNHRHQGFEKGNFEKNKTQLAMERPPETKRGQFALKGTLYDDDKTPKAAPGQASAFYAGLHSSDLTYTDRRDKQKSIAAMISEDEKHYREQVVAKQREMKSLVPDYHDEKVKRARENAEEKRRDQALLDSYNPWGKPGGGAPKVGDNRLVNQETLVEQTADELGQGKKKPYVDIIFGHQGGGAPLRNPNGKLKAKLQGDTEVMLPNATRENPNFDRANTRAKTVIPVYAKELRALADEQHKRIEQERKAIHQMTQEELDFNPFGKPGGGSRNIREPTRTHQLDEKALHYREALQKQMTEKQLETNEVNVTESYDPWGKGTGAPLRDASGKIIRAAPAVSPPSKTKYKSFAEQFGTEGGGAPVTRSKSYHGEKLQKREPTDIFGNPLTQAPPRFTDEEAAAIKEARADKKKYLRSLQTGIEDRKHKNEEETDYIKSPPKYDEFFKFAPPVRADGTRSPDKFETHPGNFRRHKTDVIMQTEARLGVRPEAPEAQASMSKALSSILADKEQSIAAYRQQEVEKERKHVESSLNWQGQGYGAPRRTDNGETTGRFALDSNLHMSEPLSNVRVMPAEQRREYQTELDRLAQEKSQLRETRRKLSAEQTKSQDFLAGFNKPGNGAPLRDKEGTFVNAPSKMVSRQDTHLLNTAAAKRF